MAFVSPYANMSEDETFSAEKFSLFVSSVQTFLNNLSGATLASPLVLQDGQHIDMSGGSDAGRCGLFGFTTILGDETGAGGIVNAASGDVQADGSNDDTEALQAKIDDLPVTGGCIAFAPGTYIVDGLKVNGSAGDRNNVTLLGAGRGSTILKWKAPASSAYMIRVAGEGSSISGIGFDGNHQDSTGNAMINVQNSQGLRISGCDIHNSSGDLMGIEGAKQLSVTDTYFHNTYTEGWGISTGAVGVADGVLITRCDFYDMATGYGALNWCSIKNAIVTGCTVTGCGGSGSIYLHSANNVSPVGISIRSNNFNGNSYAVKVDCANAASIHGISVDGNLCYNQTGGAVKFEANGEGSIYGFTIRGNICRDGARHGIDLRSGVYGGVVSGNICMDNGGSGLATDCGIAIGMEEDSVSGTCANIALSGNLCNDYRSPQLQDYGVGFGAKTSNCIFTGGNCLFYVWDSVLDLGTGNEVAHTLGY